MTSITLSELISQFDRALYRVGKRHYFYFRGLIYHLYTTLTELCPGKELPDGKKPVAGTLTPYFLAHKKTLFLPSDIATRLTTY